jgi:hypothetical protein
MIAYLFRGQPPRKLIAWGVGLLLVQLLIFAGIAGAPSMPAIAAAAGGASAKPGQAVAGAGGQFGVPTASSLAR